MRYTLDSKRSYFNNNPINMLQTQALTKSYGKKDNVFLALNDVSVDFPDGSSTAIVGKSGSGKSTLLHLLVGLDSPTNGDVVFGNKSIFSGLDTDTWRGKHVGIVFQQFFLQPNDTVIDNVALPLKVQGVRKSARYKRAAAALEHVGLSDKAQNRANDLSGGQKQRVAIARALVGKPTVLIADEPTGNLDTENGHIVEDLLFELNKRLGTTLIIVTHDEELAARCERIIRIKDGKIESDTQRQRSRKGQK